MPRLRRQADRLSFLDKIGQLAEVLKKLSNLFPGSLDSGWLPRATMAKGIAISRVAKQTRKRNERLLKTIKTAYSTVYLAFFGSKERLSADSKNDTKRRPCGWKKLLICFRVSHLFENLLLSLTSSLPH